MRAGPPAVALARARDRPAAGQCAGRGRDARRRHPPLRRRRRPSRSSPTAPAKNAGQPTGPPPAAARAATSRLRGAAAAPRTPERPALGRAQRARDPRRQPPRQPITTGPAWAPAAGLPADGPLEAIVSERPLVDVSTAVQRRPARHVDPSPIVRRTRTGGNLRRGTPAAYRQPAPPIPRPATPRAPHLLRVDQMRSRRRCRLGSQYDLPAAGRHAGCWWMRL